MFETYELKYYIISLVSLHEYYTINKKSKREYLKYMNIHF